MSAVTSRGQALHVPRVIVGAVLIVTVAFLVQTAVLPAVGLSAAVPVVFAAVVVLGMAWGPRIAPYVGFAAGLLLDLTGSGTLGVGALLGCLLGLVATWIPVDRWLWSGVGWATVATAAAALSDMIINALLAGRVPAATAWWLWIVAGSVVCIVVMLPARRWLQEVVR